MVKNYYPQVFLQECKYIVKEKEVTRHITEDFNKFLLMNQMSLYIFISSGPFSVKWNQIAIFKKSNKFHKGSWKRVIIDETS